MRLAGYTLGFGLSSFTKLTVLLILLFLTDENLRSRSLYAIAVPSVCLSSVCDVGAPYSAG